jgi:MinD-like ATPase involved in chromosome partitioning or flagellar assembly
VIILRPDQQDFQGTAVAVDVARKLRVQEMRLVVNNVLPSSDPFLSSVSEADNQPADQKGGLPE